VDGTLSTPPDDAEMLRYQANLAEVRKFTAARALRAGLPPGRANDLVIAVAELAANTVVHTSGPGTLTIWVTDDAIICQVQDQGQITDPQAGMVRPAPDARGGLRSGRDHHRAGWHDSAGPHAAQSQAGLRPIGGALHPPGPGARRRGQQQTFISLSQARRATVSQEPCPAAVNRR
jgi:hypothetical protein